MKAKIHSLKDQTETDRLDLATCKEILNANGNSYTDEEILRIRHYLYQLVEIHSGILNNGRQNNLIMLYR